MSSNSDNHARSSDSSPSDLPDDLADELSQLTASELRAVVSYAKSLLPGLPTVEDLLEELPGEEIVEVEDENGYTKVVKRQPCVQGCAECPHGPYLYHVQVARSPEDGEQPSLHWEFIGYVK